MFLALQEFESVVSGQSVLVQSDNRSVVAYIVHQGGTLSVLVSTGSQSVAVVYSSGVHLSATHIPGEGYLMADFLSRGIFLPSVWKLETSLFQRILSNSFFPPGFRFVCVFSQLPVTQVLCSESRSSCLEDRCYDISMVRSASVCIPSVLPSSQSVREGRSGGGRDSFDCSLLVKAKRQTFLSEQRTLQQRPLENHLGLLTIPSWNASVDGVRNNIVIPLLPL